MTKSELLAECKAAFQARMKEGKITPSVYPSWTKTQLSEYLKAMRSENPLGMKIAGTLHN